MRCRDEGMGIRNIDASWEREMQAESIKDVGDYRGQDGMDCGV